MLIEVTQPEINAFLSLLGKLEAPSLNPELLTLVTKFEEARNLNDMVSAICF
jgi:hypothetical protein